MKRLDVQPFPEDLVRLIRENPIDRNEDLASLISLLDSIEGPFSFFLDSEWGSGKTIFVKQLKLILECKNEELRPYEGLKDILSSDASLRNAEIHHPMLPIYFNAWENDYWDDPLPALVQTIVGEFDSESIVKRDKQLIDKLITIADSLLKPFHLNVIEDLRKGLTGENLIQSYEDRKLIRSKIQELINEILSSRAEKLLLIIDELDRCKPSFALRLLEETKTLFDDARIIVLYSINVSQIIYTIENAYGRGFDASRYLLRFYDVKFVLSRPDGKRYLTMLGIPGDTHLYNVIAKEMADSLYMTLRDGNRYVIELKRIRDLLDSRDIKPNDHVELFAEAGIIPVLLAVKVFHPSDYQKIVSEKNGALLFQYISKSTSALEFAQMALASVLGNGQRPESDDAIQDACLEMIKAYCELIWDPDYESRAYLEAREYLFQHSFSHQSLRYIKELV